MSLVLRIPLVSFSGVFIHLHYFLFGCKGLRSNTNIGRSISFDNVRIYCFLRSTVRRNFHKVGSCSRILTGQGGGRLNISSYWLQRDTDLTIANCVNDLSIMQSPEKIILKKDARDDTDVSRKVIGSLALVIASPVITSAAISQTVEQSLNRKHTPPVMHEPATTDWPMTQSPRWGL